MSNFNWGYVAGSGNWAGVTTVDPAWMTTIDQNQQKGINATDGSTHAPTDPITIGGAGMAITGQLTASSITYAAFTSSVEFAAASFVEFNNDVDFKTGSDVVFESGSTLLVSNGVTVAFQNTTNPLFAGDITLTNYPILSSKTVYKRALQLVGTTQENGSSTATSAPAATIGSRYHAAGVTSYPVVHARRMDSVQSRFWLQIPGLIDGATLAEVKVWTSGDGLAPDGSFPSYQVRRHALAAPGGWPPATIADCSLLVLDAHQVAVTWGDDMRETTLTCTTNNVIDAEDYTYLLECLTPNSTSAGTVLHVHAVQAKYTVTSLRP